MVIITIHPVGGHEMCVGHFMAINVELLKYFNLDHSGGPNDQVALIESRRLGTFRRQLPGLKSEANAEEP